MARKALQAKRDSLYIGKPQGIPFVSAELALKTALKGKEIEKEPFAKGFQKGILHTARSPTLQKGTPTRQQDSRMPAD